MTSQDSTEPLQTNKTEQSDMKNLLLICCFLTGLLKLGAQDTNSMQLVVHLYGAYEVPPNNSPNTGSGTLTLNDNVLSYSVAIGFSFTPTGAGIYGPAAPGINGPLVFDFGNYVFIAPAPNPPPGVRFGYAYSGTVVLTPQQISQLRAGLLYVNIKSERFPYGEIRGQICPLTSESDCDFDGVPNGRDLCQDTRPGLAVDANGCGIEQLCPCPGPWKNHREYVKCMREEAFRFWREGRITAGERINIVKQAEQSNCGSIPFFPGPTAPRP
jgi:hypothetical protein